MTFDSFCDWLKNKKHTTPERLLKTAVTWINNR